MDIITDLHSIDYSSFISQKGRTPNMLHHPRVRCAVRALAAFAWRLGREGGVFPMADCLMLCC
jgi:hypothetical protein